MAASEELLGKLHDMVASDLLRRIETGEATAQELAQAIKFLKDNGIEAIPVENGKLQALTDMLPNFDPEEPIHAKH